MNTTSDDPGNITEPTKAELDILQVLWEKGPSTVREVNETLNAQKKAVQYTSTLKQMQVMVERGLLRRDESSMKHVYSAAIGEEKTKGALLNRFVDSMFKGSVSGLMMQLLDNKKTSKEDLDTIRNLLDQFDKDQ